MSSVSAQSRAVVDLNLFISALISRLGQPHELYLQLKRGAFTLVMCAQLREELERILLREKFTVRFGITPDERTAFFAVMDATAIMVAPSPTVPVAVRDPKDEIVLATALAGSAAYLVTGDDDLLVLDGDPAIGSLRIVTVREFLQILEQKDQPTTDAA
jgi:putative PIN family toxin of toxin-antitoxin system